MVLANQVKTSVMKLANTVGEDDLLVQAACNGDPIAFDQLVNKYRQLVYAVAYRYTHNHEEADDLAQETFIKAYENLSGFRGEASLKTWLLRITTNLSINVKKSSRIAKDIGEEPAEFSHQQKDSLHGLISKDDKDQLRRAIQRLPERQKEALLLKTYKDLTYEEVSSIMDCSVGTVKANIFHAMKKLKQMLGGES